MESSLFVLLHDDVIKWKHFPRNWPFVRGTHRDRWIPHTKASDAELWGFSLICAWINRWVNNGEAGDLRRYRAHYDVIVMLTTYHRQTTSLNICFIVIILASSHNHIPGNIIEKQQHNEVRDISFLLLLLFKGLIMDGCVLLTSTPECVVSPRRAIPRAQPEGSPRGETTHEGVDVNNTHPSMINPDYNMILAHLTLNYQYFAY